MIVHDFDSVRVTVLPYETQTPLIVDADAVLGLPITLQSLQPVSRQGSRSVKSFGRIENVQFPKRRSLDRAETLYGVAAEKQFRIGVPEGLDHV